MSNRKILSSALRVSFNKEKPVYGFYDNLLIDSTVTYPDTHVLPDSQGYRCMRADIEAEAPSKTKLKLSMLRALYDFVRDEINDRERVIDSIIREMRSLEDANGES